MDDAGIIMSAGVLIMLGLVGRVQTGGLAKANAHAGEDVPARVSDLVLLVGGSNRDADWIEVGGEWVKLVGGLTSPDGAEARVAPVLIYQSVEGTAVPPLMALPAGVAVEIADRSGYANGHDSQGAYLKAPGPHTSNAAGFLSLTLAVSFFFFWPFGTLAQPSNMVRLMAFNNSRTLRSIVMVSIYFSVIYFLMVVIFCAGRVLLPGMDDQALDEKRRSSRWLPR
ncbi:MAG: hypothetical protein R3F19_32200 [Verrucomicrobiales bacterium]